jgi:hypothetical protein
MFNEDIITTSLMRSFILLMITMPHTNRDKSTAGSTN